MKNSAHNINKLNIVGIGPGNPDYILPAAEKVLKESDIIIGGRRNLDAVAFMGKEMVEISGDLSKTLDFIKNNYSDRVLSVIASGDPGFYSILGYLKRNFNEQEINVLPGISVLQYMFAKIGLTWENAKFASLHGRECDPVEIVKECPVAGFLTDRKHTYKYIAEILTENGLGNRIMYVGSNLSYNNELIFREKASSIADSGHDPELCVVVVVDE